VHYGFSVVAIQSSENICTLYLFYFLRNRRGRDRIVLGFTTIYVISVQARCT